jgi:hypothetical protein
MKNLTLFQYLTAFVTIVLAIALSDMLMSTHRLIVAHKRVKWNAVPMAAAVFVFLNLLSEFFSVWVGADVKSVSFFYLVVLVLVSSCSAMAAFAALPDEVPLNGLDLWSSYIDKRVYLYGVLALSYLGDVGRWILRSFIEHGKAQSLLPFVSAEAIAIALFAILAWTKNWRVHAVGLLLLYGFAYYALAGWTIK